MARRPPRRLVPGFAHDHARLAPKCGYRIRYKSQVRADVSSSDDTCGARGVEGQGAERREGGMASAYPTDGSARSRHFWRKRLERPWPIAAPRSREFGYP